MDTCDTRNLKINEYNVTNYQQTEIFFFRFYPTPININLLAQLLINDHVNSNMTTYPCRILSLGHNNVLLHIK